MIVLAAALLLSFGAREIFDYFYARIYGAPQFHRLVLGTLCIALGLGASCIVFLGILEVVDS